MRLADTVFYRFEPSIGRTGTLYLYNYRSGRIFRTNRTVYVVIKAIDQGRCAKDILRQVMDAYPDLSANDAEHFLQDLLQQLTDREIVIMDPGQPDS